MVQSQRIADKPGAKSKLGAITLVQMDGLKTDRHAQISG
jgi:hypothetical protein